MTIIINPRRTLASSSLGLLLLLATQGCGAKGSASSPAIDKAFGQAHQASVNAAETVECALTAASLATMDRQVIIQRVDSAEVASRAAARAFESAVALNAGCRGQWDAACDYKAGTVDAMLSATVAAHDRGCKGPQSFEAAK